MAHHGDKSEGAIVQNQPRKRNILVDFSQRLSKGGEREREKKKKKKKKKKRKLVEYIYIKRGKVSLLCFSFFFFFLPFVGGLFGLLLVIC
jgi:hypothetical protein